MKTEDLMIGDYIKTNDDWDNGYKNKICIVVGLRNEDGLIKCDLTDRFNCYVWSDDEDSFEPILLTKEILEKNGFKYDPNSDEPNDGWWKWRRLGVKTGNEYIDIAFRDDDVAIYDLEIMKGNSSGTFHLNYVHELQHLINLLHIELNFAL